MSEPTEQTLSTALEGLGARIRVHEIARRTGLTSKDVLAHLREHGVELPSAQSSVDADVAVTTITRILAPTAPQAEPVTEPEPTAEVPLFLEVPAEPAPKPKRTRQRKAAPAPVEDTVAADPVTEPVVSAEPAVTPEKAPRSRSRRKAAAVVEAEPTTPEPAEPAVAAPADAVVEAATDEPAEDTAARPRARRTRKTAAQKAAEAAAAAELEAPVEADPVEAVNSAEPTDAVADGTGKDETADAAVEAEGQGGRRRRGRGSRRGRGRADQHDTEQVAAERNDGSEDSGVAAEADPTGLSFVAPAVDGDGSGTPADDADAADEDADQDGQGRRRRRRGRRGRGRVESDGDQGAQAEDGEGTTDPSSDQGETYLIGADDGSDTDSTDTDGEDAAESEDGESGDRRRRRRRRRRGGSGSDEGRSDDPDNTVVHVRESRPAASSSSEEVQGVKGSTRLEAKRQRRRDSRESRKRPQILSEAEFLARRESVDRVMAVRQRGDLAQVALLEDGVLVEHFVSRDGAESLMGNIYLGRVQNVLPSMEAAFVDIGRGRNAVLYAGEVNWSAAGLAGKARRIETALSSGDTVLVQVSKDPIGHKGARLTTQISLPGRFLVYVPGGGATGISRKLPDTERKRLKSILDRIVPSDAGVIIRTAAEGVPEEDLAADVERLKAAWADIQQRAEQKQSAPVQLSAEPDTLIKVVRDLFNSDIHKLVLDGPQIQDKVADYVAAVAPELSERVEKFDASVGHDVFHRYRIDEQISKALARKVHLPSGGSLVIDRTEAMTVVDVNTGKYTGSGGNLEETVTRNNLEAAEEVVRQLRLRDIGGIIVVDFIDMVLESNRELVLRRLTEALGRDRSRHQVAEVTSLGLVQMTRKRIGTGLVEAFSEPCPHCQGRGIVLHDVPVDNSPHVDEDNGNRRRRGGRAGGNDRPQSKPEPLVEVPRVVVAATRRPDPRGPKAPSLAGGHAEHSNGHAAEPAAAASDAPVTEPSVEVPPAMEPADASTSATVTEAEAAAAEAAAAVAQLVGAVTAPAADPDRETGDVAAVLAALDALPVAEPAPRRRGRRAAGRAAGPAGAAMPIVLPDVDAALDAAIDRSGTSGSAPAVTAAVVEQAAGSPDAAAENSAQQEAAQSDAEPSEPGADVPGQVDAPAPRTRRRRAARRPAGPAQS